MPKRSKSKRKGRSKSPRKKSRRNKKGSKRKSKVPLKAVKDSVQVEGQGQDEDQAEGQDEGQVEGQDEVEDEGQIQGQAKATKGNKGKKAKSKKGKKSKERKGVKGRKGGKSKSKSKSPKGKGKGKKKGKVKAVTEEEEEEEEHYESEEEEAEEEEEEEEEDEEVEVEVISVPTSGGQGQSGGQGSGSSYSGSGSSETSDFCASGEYETTSSEEMASTASSFTLLVPESRSNDACAILEEMEAEMVTKATIRKCRGIEVDEDEEEKEKSDEEEESHQKEAPDFNYVTTYEEYLDHYVTSKDLYYFESDDVARTITTLGFRVPELLTREQFAEVMQEIQAKRFAKRKDDVHIAYGIPPGEITCPLMQALAEREKQNRTGNMACIVYIRMLNKKNQEISGWIDFKLRLTKDGTEVWTDYFRGKRRFIPRNSDLCYYNWTTFQIRYNSSDNYLVTTDIAEGLQFLNKLDRKLITVNPRVRPGDNTELVKVKSPHYLDAVIYDHFLRVKA